MTVHIVYRIDCGQIFMEKSYISGKIIRLGRTCLSFFNVFTSFNLRVSSVLLSVRLSHGTSLP